MTDVFDEVGGLTDDEQERATRSKKGSKKDKYTKRTAPYGRKSGCSMTHQTMIRLSADHAYSKQVTARFFVHHSESNMYSVKKINGLTFDSGAHVKKGTFVSEDEAMTFVSAVIARQPTAERDAATARLASREGKTCVPSPPRTDPIINSSKDPLVPDVPGDPDDDSDGSTSNSSSKHTSRESVSTHSSVYSTRSRKDLRPGQSKPNTTDPKTRRCDEPMVLSSKCELLWIKVSRSLNEKW